ncbi:galactose-1-phosphate uridylyltransferase [Spirillospora sp. NPDC048911]|uniref:galactose-1-phosphate uridylyltransferase n=1 Tax=Spirillospora sp. NPDC048911 TaxID=3364527 RepID=UPI00371D3352
MKRTVTRLADGRELIYFDRRDDADRSAVDQRPLPGRAAASELRHDPLLDEWVAVAAHRQTRTFLPSADDCPLCPSAPGRPTEIPAPDYEVAVFENRFPSYGDGTSGGRCEVVCFTSEHGRSFAELPPEQVQTVIEAWADRTAELSTFPGVEQVFCFENRGEAIGVTLHHPHGQIYGYPFVPPRTRRMLDVARRHPGDLFAEVLAAEREEGVRVVTANDLWTAFVPKAARYPYEVHVYPHRRVPDLPALDSAEREALGALYLDVLGRLDRLFGFPLPYVSAWHQAPVRADRDLAWLHLELFSIQRAPGKLKFLAGSESAMGAFVNDVSPEDAARSLREA